MLFYTGHSLLYIKQYGVYIHYLVILYQPDCEVRTDSLIYDSAKDTCTYPQKAVLLALWTARFISLDEGTWTLMVVRMPGGHNIAEDGGCASTLKALDGELIGIPPGVVALLPLATTSCTVIDNGCDTLPSLHPF
jgi:hypothetical protein